jgi:hypothetical protein
LAAKVAWFKDPDGNTLSLTQLGGEMSDNKVQSPQHSLIRTVLRIGGPIIILVGLTFMIVGIGSFFSAFGTFEPPRYFWCVFVGIPLLFVGSAMCMFGFLGSYYRYVAGEAAPVAKDVVNYMGENTQPGVQAVAKAAAKGVSEGIIEAQKEQQQKQ